MQAAFRLGNVNIRVAPHHAEESVIDILIVGRI